MTLLSKYVSGFFCETGRSINFKMNKFLSLLFVAAVVATVQASCPERRKAALKCYEAKVNTLVNDQIGVELKGHYTYLYLSYFFDRHDHYYPRAAKYFRKKSDEEMSHAEKFIQYQNQRGGTYDIRSVTRKTDGKCASLQTLLDGFECAKELEIEVTHALTYLLAQVSDVKPENNAVCDGTIAEEKEDLLMGQSILLTANGKVNTVHNHRCEDLEPVSSKITKAEYVELSEMIAHDFLGHQIEDTKELADYESTLRSMGDTGLASFLADKHFEL